MKTGFLIVNYNDFETTSILLDNIQNYKCIDCIVVVDNKSTDKSYEKLYDKYQSKNLDVIQNISNKGYASGMNLGCKYLEEQWGDCNIIISNSDIVIESEDTLKNLMANKPKGCAIIAPIIKEHEGLNRGWKIPTPMQDVVLNIVWLHKYLRPKMLFYNKSHFEEKLVEVEALSGCFFMVDSRSLNEVNYFDENTFLYYEENIIGKKMQIIGRNILINTEVEVFHNHSITIDKNINHLKKFKVLKESQYYFQTKYNNAGTLSSFLLKLTSKLSYLILYVMGFLKRGSLDDK